MLVDGAPDVGERCSTSACTCSTTGRRRSRAAAGRTSTCRSSRATSRRGCGTTCSRSRSSRLGIPHGSIRATVLIETVLAAFEMEEILYELRDHSAGLNAGRWDYIFSIIKKFRGRSDMLLPDRAQVTMAVPFMRAYTSRLVQICHRRGAHAIGGMAAFIPNRKRRGGDRGRGREGARGQAARGGRRLRRHLGRASRPRARRDAGLRRSCSASARTRRSGCARTCASRPTTCCG